MLAKNIKKFTSKTESHKKRGNEKKSAAYKKKLDKTTVQLESLVAEIKRIKDTTSLSKEELDPILEKLEKTGCYAEK